MLHQQLSTVLVNVRKQNPLVHNITNVVVTNFTANGLLAIGASPVMAYAIQEVADMAKIAGALVLNIGTLNETEIEAMLAAGRSANENGVPVILDPVGAGATAYRTDTARRLVNELKISVLRGNAAEVANVIGEAWTIKGVDAGEGNGSVIDLARQAAKKLDTVVAITGREDVITDGETAYVIANGHPVMTKVTGMGCLLTSVIGAFAAVENDVLLAGIAALTTYGVAAEMAAEDAAEAGPGSFQIAFLDQLAKVSEADVLTMGKARKYNFTIVDTIF